MSRALPLLLTLLAPALARDVPAPSFPLVDEARLLDRDTGLQVRAVSVSLQRATSAELGILIVQSTRGEDPRAFGLRVFNAWGVGKRGVDNGALLLFALQERRVELIVGLRYEGLFTPAASEALLKEHVVPDMRAKRPAQAVLGGVCEVARRISEWESGRERPVERVQVEVESYGGGRPSEGSPPPPPPPPARPTPRPMAASAAGRPITDSHSPRGLMRAAVVLMLLCWAGFMGWAVSRAWSTGDLVVGRSGLYGLSLLGPAAGAGLLWLTSGGMPETADWWLGGGGGVGGLLSWSGVSHICHRCNRYMAITSRTLRAATYSSSGTGERTYHCGHCRYHRVETYTIARRRRSSSRRGGGSRSSFGGGGGSRPSFGGGSSRGGGGGASW